MACDQEAVTLSSEEFDISSTLLYSGRPVGVVGKHDSLRISTDLLDPKSFTAHATVPVQSSVNSPSVAETTLVFRNSPTDASIPHPSTSETRFASTAKNNNLPSSSRNIQSGCMAVIDGQLRSKGFSRNARELLAASWRKGTQKDYSVKFRNFASWCCERKVDPYTASIVQIIDFLTDLFQKGRQYRTVAGYRSMLSSVLPPVNNIPVGQHPYIVCLIKGVFNSRPPQVKLVPEWDLDKVLKTLKRAPYEPIKSARLKYLGRKTAFLFAITSFRRCSDLCSLGLGDGFIQIHRKGITFSRPGLAKQDRPSHFGSCLFIPRYVKDKLLDPVRAFSHYLQRTEQFRNVNGGDETRVFLGIAKPHAPVSAQTISSWISQLIKEAYDGALCVKGHSTRAIGPSWAASKGASLKSIMQAADWSSENTFSRFYLRDVPVNIVNVLEKQTMDNHLYCEAHIPQSKSSQQAEEK
ncbi:hypothetical protein ScPMuIL_007478, partial [Solemya velum]